MKIEMISTRASEQNANRNLWRNGSNWWIAYTIHLPEYQKRRIRVSLQTNDLTLARRRRDNILARFSTKPAKKTKTVHTTLLVSFFRITRFPVKLRSSVQAC